MAGMLPGVEAARRRRFHKSNNISISNNYSSDQLYPTTSSRRSSFCLYATSHDHLHSNCSMQMRNPITRQESGTVCDESRLGAAAREAKKRLDQRLQPQWRSHNRTESSTPSNQERPTMISSENRPCITSQVDYRVPKLKTTSSRLLKRPSWLKINWKSSEQDECAVCLDRLQGGSTLMELPCGHRFHTKCLAPWLEANAHCPCCRLEISSS